MERIVIDIAVDEFDFVKEAIAFKARSLISYLDTCKEHAQQQEEEVLKEHGVLTTKRRVGRPPLKKRR
jgi:hypothetical protein